MNVKLLRHPTDDDWIECYRRALITVFGRGIDDVGEPSDKWKKSILRARHSPIRYLSYSFLITDIPSNVSVHLCRHVHAQPYVSSLRNDRQEIMDGDSAPRSTPVNMILDVNAEELMVIANKRLCNKASEKTREVVRMMRDCVVAVNPEMTDFLVPMCQYHGGMCHEMHPCGCIAYA